MTDDDSPKEESRISDVVSREGAKSISQAAGNLLERALGPAADEVGDIIVSQIRSWRWRRQNLENIAKKHAAEVEHRGINTDGLKPLPEGDAYRLLEAASMEDDEIVQDLWAGLITSAMDPSSEIKISKAYIDILEAIGPIEASLLLLLIRLEKRPARPPESLPPQELMKFHHENMARETGLINEFAEKTWRRYPYSDRESAIQNLMRLRCIGFRKGRQLKSEDLLRSVPMITRDTEINLNPRGLVESLDYLESLVLALSGTADVKTPGGRDKHNTQIPESLYELTALGESLMQACDVEVTETEENS